MWSQGVEDFVKLIIKVENHLYFSCNHILNLRVRLMQWIKRPMVASQAQNNMQIEQFIIGKGDHTLLDFSERSSVNQSIHLDRQILENFQNKEKICRRVQSRKQPTFAMLELLRELNYYSNKLCFNSLSQIVEQGFVIGLLIR